MALLNAWLKAGVLPAILALISQQEAALAVTSQEGATIEVVSESAETLSSGDMAAESTDAKAAVRCEMNPIRRR